MANFPHRKYELTVRKVEDRDGLVYIETDSLFAYLNPEKVKERPRVGDRVIWIGLDTPETITTMDGREIYEK